jgi:menaquinone-dependent protoporphyrinogen IX oxidase
MQKLAEHTGEWLSLKTLKEKGRKVEQQELKKVLKVDLQEGKPVIIGHTIWVVFLYDRIRQRYFLEEMYVTSNKKEMFEAFAVLQEEWV